MITPELILAISAWCGQGKVGGEDNWAAREVNSFTQECKAELFRCATRQTEANSADTLKICIGSLLDKQAKDAETRFPEIKPSTKKTKSKK